VDSTSHLLAAVGGFHIVLLHFPIGFVAAAACLELWALARPRPGLRAAGTLLLALAAATAVAAAACGWLLAAQGGYDQALLERHRWLGVATAVLALVALGLRGRAPHAVEALGLAACVVVTAAAGHVGGMLTHGSTTPFDALAHALRGAGGTTPAVEGADPTVMAAAAILQAHCVECHGPEKQKHGLRLDSRAAALAGGESGKPAIVPGNAIASQMIEAVTLPQTNERAMPPDGKPRLTPEQVIALVDWINAGALWLDATQAAAAGVEPAAAETLDALRAAGFHLGPLARDNPLIRVDVVPADASLADLEPIADRIVWLDLAGRRLAPGDTGVLAGMSRLTRLGMQRSSATDADLAELASLPTLAVLNLYGTAVGDPGLAHLQQMTSLERVYLWGTRVTDAGVERLRAAAPALAVERGE